VAETGRTLAMSDKDIEAGPSIEAPFGKALVEVARRRSDMVGLTADLGKYTDMHPFRDAYPERFFNVGMAEQNLVAVAAGLAKTGRVAFATTYGVFATRRAYDFIAIACAHSKANVKIVAGLPGLTTGYGGTHQAIEDLALMIRIPGLVVIDPCDATEIMQATHAIADHAGPVYMRLQRASVPVVLDPTQHQFTIGKAALLRDGDDIGIISTGLMTARALTAARQLAASGIEAGILHVATWKPFDAAAVAGMGRRVRALLTVENHITNGGLASLVAEALFDSRLSRPLERIGLPDQFIECGSVPFLQSKYGLSSENIVSAARRALARKE
jgi:transketolase